MKTPDNPLRVAQGASSETRTNVDRRGPQRSQSTDDLLSQAQRTLVQISRQSGIGDPKTCFCVLTLLTAGRRVREALGTLMGVDAVSEGSLATLVMLYALDPVPSTAADLAYHAQVTRSSMTQILYALERRGHLTRGPNGEDRRPHFIYLTEQGREEAATVSQQFLRAADDLASGFSVNQYTTLIDTCQQLIERASGVRPQIFLLLFSMNSNLKSDQPAANRKPFFLAIKVAAISFSALSLALAGCSRPANAQPTTPGAGAPPEVGVTSLTPTTVPLTRELPGRVSAFRVAEVRARVDGIILKRLFTEGADVKEGQPLFQIDPAPYDAAVESARATLAKAEANVASARLQAQRYKELVAANAVSRQEYDNAVASLGAFDADIAVAKAAIKTSTINLGYTTVTSPVSGRIGRSSVTEGAYVQQSQATLLATVQQLDPVYVDLTQSSTELLKLKAELASGQLKNEDANAKVTALIDGQAYGQSGQLQFSDVTVDPSTGSVVLRALFPNPTGDLLPGMFVRARVELGAITGAILVPQVAVTRNPQGNAVAYVVGKDNKIEPRILATGRTVGDRWLVSAGVASGDRVVVDGLQRLRPGLEVKPVPADATMPTAVR